jgi:hypothetical protein
MTFDTPQTDTSPDDQTIARLEALRLELLAKVWPTAEQASVSFDHETVRELVRLKVDIEAIDFAMAHRPGRVPT